MLFTVYLFIFELPMFYVDNLPIERGAFMNNPLCKYHKLLFALMFIVVAVLFFMLISVLGTEEENNTDIGSARVEIEFSLLFDTPASFPFRIPITQTLSDGTVMRGSVFLQSHNFLDDEVEANYSGTLFKIPNLPQ